MEHAPEHEADHQIRHDLWGKDDHALEILAFDKLLGQKKGQRKADNRLHDRGNNREHYGVADIF